MRISLSTRAFNGMPIEKIAEKAARTGYSGIEIWVEKPYISADILYQNRQYIRDVLDHYSLELAVIGSTIGEFSTVSDRRCECELEELEKILMSMSTLKCRMLEVRPGGPNSFIAEKYQYYKSIYWIKRCASLASEYDCNILLALGNGTLMDHMDSILEYMDMLERTNVGLIHDAGNMYISDTDYGVSSVELLGDKIFHIRVKDVMRVNGDIIEGTFHSRTIYGNEIFKYQPLGEGDVDYVPLFKALIDDEYEGFISSEHCVPNFGIDGIEYEFKEIKRQIQLAKCLD